MKEACRLLNKSIIRVEQPDIQLEEEEEENIIPMGELLDQNTSDYTWGVVLSLFYILSAPLPVPYTTPCTYNFVPVIVQFCVY